MDPPWRIELLGGLSARRGEQVVSRFRTRKAAELLAYLAITHSCRRRAQPREVLAELLWPEGESSSARHSLSMALSSLRQELEPPGVPDGSVLVADRQAIGLNPAAVTTDVEEFEAALKAAAHAPGDEERAACFSTAIDLYSGELLPGFYAEWIFPEQQRLEELYFQALRQVVAQLERTGELDRALQYALRAVAGDRLREEAHRDVMRLYTAAGQPDAALRQYRELERLLKQELDTTPAADSRALAQATARVSPERLPAPLPVPRSEQLEPVGGAVPLGSRFYVERPTDDEFREAIGRRDSIVLVKGARQVGKTSLLARGLEQARQAGARVVMTHFQTLTAADLEGGATLLQALAESIAEQLELEESPAAAWDPRRSSNHNFRRFLRRQVLDPLAVPVVWGIDEIDRLIPCPYASEIFALFRSWHDERALEPGGPWTTLTLAIAYSTEAHLFITDLNQSPFNVGTRLALEDFTREQVADLNRRYGSPIPDDAGLTRYYGLVGGHPYLVRRGLHELAARPTPVATLETRATSDEWIFGEHLRRIVVLLARDPELCEAARAVLQDRPCPTREAFHRLRSAGVLTGEAAHQARPRCQLYATYLAQHLL